MKITKFLDGKVCNTALKYLLFDAKHYAWSLAYTLAWISVSEGNSVLPPWVYHSFPDTRVLIHRLRNTACASKECHWCLERHNATNELKRYFNFDSFRPEPRDSQGRSMQKQIVESAMAGKDLLAILPTGTGKSLCFQLPALSTYANTGALTVVISPLVALMEDQIRALQELNISCCTAVSG